MASRYLDKDGLSYYTGELLERLKPGDLGTTFTQAQGELGQTVAEALTNLHADLNELDSVMPRTMTSATDPYQYEIHQELYDSVMNPIYDSTGQRIQTIMVLVPKSG